MLLRARAEWSFCDYFDVLLIAHCGGDDFCRARSAAINDYCKRAVENDLACIGIKSLSLFIAFAQDSAERASADEKICDGDAFLNLAVGRAAQVEHYLLRAFCYKVIQLRLDLGGFALNEACDLDVSDARLFHSRLNRRLIDFCACDCELARLALIQHSKLNRSARLAVDELFYVIQAQVARWNFADVLDEITRLDAELIGGGGFPNSNDVRVYA